MKRPVSTETWTQIAAGALLLAALAYAGWFRALLRGDFVSAAILLLWFGLVFFVAAAVWPALFRLFSHLFYGDPYWIRPRPFEADEDRAKMQALDARLDLVDVDDSAMLWHDRESGQYWASRKFGTSRGAVTRFKPLRKREHWAGMADEDWQTDP